MTTHAKISLSQASRALECSGSIYMKDKFPPQPSSEAAKEGTLFHEVLEKILGDHLVDGKEIYKAFEEYQDLCADEEMKAHVLDTCLEVQKQLLQIGMKNIKRIALEKKFMLSEKHEIGGTADLAFVVLTKKKERVLVIWDFKYGAGLGVEVEDNAQLAGYAASAHVTADWGPFDRAIVHIYQPRYDHPDGPLRAMRLEAVDIEEWQAKLLKLGLVVAEEAASDKPTFNPGEHCRWCVADGQCAAQLNRAETDAQMEFTPAIPDQEPELPAVHTLTTSQKEAIVRHRKALEGFFKAVEKAVLEEMNNGGIEYSSLKLVHARTRRSWVKNTDGVIETLEAAGMDEPYERKVCTLQRVTKELGKKRAEEIFADWTAKPEGVIQVAPVTDKRVAIEPQITEAQGEFDEPQE